MINKILTFLIRGVIVFFGAAMVGTIMESAHDAQGAGVAVALTLVAGGLYILFKFNEPYNLIGAKAVDAKISEAIDNKTKKNIEDEMLRLKKLLDAGILSEEEYNQKLTPLKDKYFQ